MTTRSLLLLLFVATSASTVACGTADETTTGSSHLSKDSNDDDNAGDDDDSASVTTPKSSKTTKTSVAIDEPEQTTPADSTTSTPLPTSTDLKATAEQLHACLIGCADEACAQSCFADFAGNLAGGAGGAGDDGNDASIPCCTPGGGFFLCPAATQCGDAGCQAREILDGLCGGQ